MPATRAALYRRWVLACTAGELVGFGAIPALGGVLAFYFTANLGPDLRSILLYCVAVAGGLGEGAVLAWFQLRVLARHLEQLDRRAWIRATALAAAIAWACGMLAPTLDELVGLSATAQIVIWIPAAVLILCSIGFAQARVLAAVTQKPREWFLANLLGWLLGLPWTFVLPALLPEAAPPAAWMLTFAVAGVLMGLTVGLVTGVALLRMRQVHEDGVRPVPASAV